MTDEKRKRGRPAKNIDEELAAAEALVKALKEKKREELQREREAHQAALLALFKESDIDSVPLNQWQANMAQIKALLTQTRPARFDQPAPVISEVSSYTESA